MTRLSEGGMAGFSLPDGEFTEQLAVRPVGSATGEPYDLWKTLTADLRYLKNLFSVLDLRSTDLRIWGYPRQRYPLPTG
jgi:hypothetical protein